MIVQTATAGQPRFVIPQIEHTRMAGRFAEAWGNARFAPLAPRELMLHLVAHHDDGWDVVDAEVGRDAQTGLPWDLVKTPLQAIVKSSARGPELNERHHPFCGLLSSMHSYGLYHGRYGLSDKVFINMVPAEHRAMVDDMLGRELARQARLKAELAKSPETAAWVEERALFHNYKLLQFFDTFSLYFNCTHAEARGRATFHNVPRALGDDVTITVEPAGEGAYRLDPYPFSVDGVEITCAGHFMSPVPEGTDMPRAVAATPRAVEKFRLVSS